MTDSSSLANQQQPGGGGGGGGGGVISLEDCEDQQTYLRYFQSCELLLLSKLGWDVYLDCQQEEHVILLDNLNFS